MPTGLLETALAAGRFGPDDNRRMVDYTREMMAALRGSKVQSLECYQFTAWEPEPVIEAMLEAVEGSAGIEFWSVHAPYGPHVDPSYPDQEIRRAAVRACVSAIDAAKKLGARLIVVHPGAETGASISRCERLKLSAQTLAEIADLAGEQGISMAIETLPKHEIGNTVEELSWLIETIDRANVGTCLDTNHLFPASSLPAAIRSLGPQLWNVHVSDHDGTGERHWLPFEGVVNWKATIKALWEAGYRGPLVYEAWGSCNGTCRDTVEKIEKSYGRMRQVIAECPFGG